MEPILAQKNVAWKIHGCHKPHGTKCVLVQKWDANLKPDQMIMKIMKMIYVRKSPHILIGLILIRTRTIIE
jgi:hypothetical protein